MTGTNAKSDTPLTQPGSQPVLYELIDKDGEIYATFQSAKTAAGTAAWLWPDQQQDPDRTGAGWTVQQVGADYIHQRADRGPVDVRVGAKG